MFAVHNHGDDEDWDEGYKEDRVDGYEHILEKLALEAVICARLTVFSVWQEFTRADPASMTPSPDLHHDKHHDTHRDVGSKENVTTPEHHPPTQVEPTLCNHGATERHQGEPEAQSDRKFEVTRDIDTRNAWILTQGYFAIDISFALRTVQVAVNVGHVEVAAEDGKLNEADSVINSFWNKTHDKSFVFIVVLIVRIFAIAFPIIKVLSVDVFFTLSLWIKNSRYWWDFACWWWKLFCNDQFRTHFDYYRIY